MRKLELTTGEYYHVFNRGVGKKKIFCDNRDKIRFLFLVLYHQSPSTFYNLSRQVSYFVKHQVFNISIEEIGGIVSGRFVSVVAFALMENHFHLILRQEQDGGVSKYMQKIGNSCAKYFNTKYKEVGHLFQSPFKAVHLESNEQLLYASAYIHRNPRELPGWKNREQDYPWSSFGDYIRENRWLTLLDQSILLEQFGDKGDYVKFVEENPAKEGELLE